jgi:hypothetical protein
LGAQAFKGAMNFPGVSGKDKGTGAESEQKKSSGFFGGALKFGKDLFNGAMGFGQKVLKNNPEALVNPGFVVTSVLTSPEAKKFTEAIPGWIDKQVDNSLKRRSEIINASLKPLEHIPVVGKAAQAFAWFDNKMGEFGGGVLKGAGSLVGGVANIVTHPVETASGIYAMAEHVPLMGGLVPNPLKLAHAGVDVMFNGADPKSRLETVMDPGKSLQDDAKFGKALVKGFIEPYKKSWSEGKYFEVAGRATFDIGSMFIGAGEANAAIKTGEVASVAAKTAEVANVASKTGEIANVASKSGKAAEVASTTGKTTGVAETAGKTGKVSKVAADTSKATKGEARAARTSSATKIGEEASTAGKLEPGNPNSTSLPRNGKRNVRNQLTENTDVPHMACGPTSCGMVLDTAGKPADVTKLAKQANLGERGTRIRDLAEVLRGNGVNARHLVGDEVSVRTIEEATRRGHPAIVRMELGTSEGGKYGHFVVVDGITNRAGQKVVAVRDPAGGRQYFVPIDEFSQKLPEVDRHALFTNPKMQGKGWVVPH